MTSAIDVINVSKVYRRYARKRQFATLKSAILDGSLLADLKPDETFQALRNVSFSVPKGCTYGVIGSNGSGKSTLLKCVAGITRPTEGDVKVDGRISALIELGAGFHPEISGRENIFINGIMLGLTKKEIQRRFDEIVEFAEMQDFIDAPVKTYSSGMYMRLGFAVAVHVDPEVLLVDEVLAVGDQSFTHKCLDKFAEFRRRNKSILLVTHSLDLVEKFCDVAHWLNKGVTKGEGDPKRVVAAYVMDVEDVEENTLAKAEAVRVAASAKEVTEAQETAISVDSVDSGEGSASSEESNAPKDGFKSEEGRWGTREVEITNVTISGPNGDAGHVFQSGESIQVRMDVTSKAKITDFVFGLGLFNADNVCVYGTNTNLEEFQPTEIDGSAIVTFTIDKLDLVEGTYRLDLAAHKADGYPYDYHRLLYTFRVKSRIRDVGIYRPDHSWSFEGGIKISNQ
ncbi:MAG TPA: ABC transporter ATP-binding protein [Vicinamibacterales bacterium]|jgi:ABC-type polysaccharide/polyol phosphate transport system ATPase subunit|nr:ABC transporter ATP-binding protein [Vicinamibacterales bacterium]